MHTCQVLFTLIFISTMIYGRLERHSFTHGPSGKPGIHCYGDVHRARDLQDQEAIKAIHAKEKEQCDCIIAKFKAYKGGVPLHFFIESHTSLEEYHIFCDTSGVLFVPLYVKLKQLTEGTTHRVEDIDIRKVIGVASIFLRRIIYIGLTLKMT